MITYILSPMQKKKKIPGKLSWTQLGSDANSWLNLLAGMGVGLDQDNTWVLLLQLC